MPETDNTTPSAETVTLVVTQPFDDYQRGDVITDAEKVAQILAGEWTANVVKRAG